MTGRLLLTLLLCIGAAAPAAAKDYFASRFDSRIQVRDDGSLAITETIVFVFDGTFSRVFRTIPTRRTDGIELVSASMDGRPFDHGTEAGRVEVRRKNGIRVEWHFTPVTDSSHSFELVYTVRGVVRREDGADLLAWRALPTEHEYRIAESTVEILAGATPLETELKTRRVEGGASVTPGDGTVRITAAGIRRNGWIEPHLRFPLGALVENAPQWQQRRVAQMAMAPTWVAVAGGIVAIGLVLLIGLRQGYDAPPRSGGTTWASLIPPDDLAPALAGTLVTNGHVQLQHAMAALFGLAERGVVAIREQPKGTFGVRQFEITRGAGASNLAPHESALLDILFKGHGVSGHISLSKARTAMMRQWKTFRAAVDGEMHDAGLTDARRRAHRNRYVILGVIGMIVAAAAFVASLPFVDRFGTWPMLVALAVLLVSFASFIFSASETPLSNEGVRRGDAWRGYQRHLKNPQEIEPRWGASASAEARILPYAVALGLAAAWAKFMKKRNVQLPAWFQPASTHDGGPAFAAFIASGGAGAGGAGGGGAAGAAGGGASGAS